MVIGDVKAPHSNPNGAAMADVWSPPATATRMCALPGAVFTKVPRPDFVNGRMMRLPTSVLQDMPCPSFLIEHPRGLVLFDTGISPKGLANPEAYFPNLVDLFGFECRPDLGIDAQLRGLGLRPERITYVIPSHLHFDHAGGLYLFPNATFIVGAGEMGYAYRPDGGYQPYYLLDDLAPTRGFRWIEADSDFDLFGDGSVRVLLSPGHTPGSLALFVRLPNQNFILTGDACHYRSEVEHGVADNLHDEARGIHSLHRLILIRDAWDATLWVGHDPGDWDAFPHAPEYIE